MKEAKLLEDLTEHLSRALVFLDEYRARVPNSPVDVSLVVVRAGIEVFMEGVQKLKVRNPSYSRTELAKELGILVSTVGGVINKRKGG